MWPPVWDYRKSLEARKGRSTISSRPSAESDYRPSTLIRTLWATRLWQNKLLLFKVTKLGTSLVVQRLWFHLAMQGPPLVSKLRFRMLSGPNNNNNVNNRSGIVTNSVLHMKSLQPSQIVCDPMDCIPPGAFACGILQARIPEWAATPSSRGPSRRGIKPSPLTAPALASRCHQCHLGSPTNSIKT